MEHEDFLCAIQNATEDERMNERTSKKQLKRQIY